MWVFNVFLFMIFLSNPAGYREWKDAGMPCYGYVSDHGEQPTTPMPVCFYDTK